jgi:hypothetical protein
MIAADITRAALHATLAALIFSGSVRLWEIVAIEASFGGARAFFQPAYSGLLPQTVPESLIQDARALTSSTANLASMVGPALGAALVLGVGAGTAFAFDAATFVVSALFLTAVRARRRGVPAPAASMISDLRAGWHEVRSRAWVWVTIAAFTGMLMCMLAPWYALAPTIAGRVYGSIGVFGLVESMIGLGAVCGAFAGLRWRPLRPLRAGLLLLVSWPATLALFAFGAPLALVLAGALTAGFGFSLFGVWWETALARYIPPHALSRVSAWDWMGSLALLPLGYASAGPLASAFGPRMVLGAGCAIGLALLALALTPHSTRKLAGSTAQLDGRRADGLVSSHAARAAAGTAPDARLDL